MTTARPASRTSRWRSPDRKASARRWRRRPRINPGEYRAEFTPRLEGSHRIEVQASSSGKPLGKSAANFLVALPSEENDDGRPRPELLAAVAERSQGMFAPAASLTDAHWSEFEQLMERAAPSSIVARSRVALWNEPLLFTLAVLLLGAEWWLRRTWGLV